MYSLENPSFTRNYFAKGSTKIHPFFDCIVRFRRLAEYCNLLELANYIRNALVHNNGYHNKESVCIRWKDLTVEFWKDKVVLFNGRGWNAMFVISSGILEMLIKVINSSKIMEKPIIKDLSFDDDSPY